MIERDRIYAIKRLILSSLNVMGLYLLGFAAHANPQQSNLVLSKPKQIESLIRHSLPNANIGILLKDAKTGKTLYERRAKELFPPASLAKLFVASASLLSLKPDYRFATTVEIDKETLQQGKLTGNLYLRFSGDPSLTTDDLKSLIFEVKKAGIQHILGDIVIDNTVFQPPNYARGWSWDSLPWYFSAPVTTIILNENQIPICLLSNGLGEKITTTCDSENCKLICLTSDVISVTEETAETGCQIQVDTDQENAINIKGCWPYQPKPKMLKIALRNPDLFAERLILETFRTENIQFNGKVVFHKVSENLTMLASHYSLPLTDLLKKVLQESNNMYADSLTKTLGARNLQQGTFQLGVRTIKEVLEPFTSIDFKNLLLLDGSGLSHYNLVTPLDLSRLLLALYHDEKNNKIFQELLPISGEKGTLTNCLNTPDLKGRIRAKTGKMSNTYNLAGYLRTERDKDLVFVMMIDHVMEDREKINQFQNDLCRLFTKF